MRIGRITQLNHTAGPIVGVAALDTEDVAEGVAVGVAMVDVKVVNQDRDGRRVLIMQLQAAAIYDAQDPKMC